MKNDTSKKIVTFIEKNKQVTPKELVNYLGITKQAVFRHLSKLIENQAIFKNGKPPKVFYFITVNTIPKKPALDLFEKQTDLQKQSTEVLSRLDLINTLSTYGEAKIVGSVALGLMTWPDIDIDLESKKEINSEDYFKIIKYLFKQKNINQLILIDNRSAFEKNRPQSFYIGVIYNLNGINWKIDIRYLTSSSAYAGDDLKQIRTQLSEDKIKSILEIKTAFHNHPKYRKEFSGYDIYKAVLEKNISTIEEFKKYLKVIGINF